MTSTLLARLPLAELSPAKLWATLDPETRRQAGREIFDPRWEDRQVRTAAMEAIAEVLRFRIEMVRKLPIEKRVGYLAGKVRPDDSLAFDLLLALHLGERRAMLCAFLDHLGIPHDDGIVDPDHDPTPPAPAALRSAASRLGDRFPRPHVELYLASLLAMDRDTWGGLGDLLTEWAERAAPEREDHSRST